MKEDQAQADTPVAGGQWDGITKPRPNLVLEELFTYHAPTGDQPERYNRIRAAAKELAYVIDECCEPGPDRTAAIRHIREAVMTANASIATRNAQYR